MWVSVEHKRRYFEIKELINAIDIYSMETKYYESHWGLESVWLSTLFKVFCDRVCSTEELIQVWNTWGVIKWWQNFHFRVNYFFKKNVLTDRNRLRFFKNRFCRSSLGRKSYVVLSVILCLLASFLVAFFLFPRPVLVVDDGIRSVTVHFNRNNSKVIINMTVIPFLLWIN